MEDALTTVPELAARLSADPKQMRAWMRRRNWRHPVEKFQPWRLDAEQVGILSAIFGPSSGLAGEQAAEIAEPVSAGPLAGLTVGELLNSYSDILAELRSRGLVRTNNAPIGDLAEYCAAVVYDGLLAPNSEKSYDLVSADGRKVQVKVRLLRAETSTAAAFSPIRSFDFDVCVFVLIDNQAGTVIAAREWTAADVREHGRHISHTNGTVMRIRQITVAGEIGLDLTAEFDAAWRELLTQR